jgi:hypothetical protein
MIRHALPCLIVLALGAAPVSAQTRPSRLASVFDELFGPNGLVVNSEDRLPDGSTHSAHFNSTFQSNFSQFNIALVSQLTSLPLPSPAAGFTYRFDAATGTFIRSTRSFGPILTDRAETIGRGRFAFGYNFQFYSFDRLEGIDLTAVPAVFTHDDHQLGGGRTDVVTTKSSIDLSVGQWTGALTYGVNDWVDLSIAVPIVHTTLRVVSAAQIERMGTTSSPTIHFFRDPDAPEGIGSHRSFEAGGSASGLGDMVVRAKAAVLRQGPRGLAVGLDTRLPTGDERNLLGSGALGLKPFAAFSGAFGRVAPHVNVAYQWNGDSVLAGDVETGEKADIPDQFLYAFGADVGVTDRFSMTVDWLGRRAMNSPRVQIHEFQAVGPDRSAVFDDIELYRESFWASSAAVGFKANVKGSLLIDVNLRFTLGTNGLTDKVTPLVGIEYSF